MSSQPMDHPVRQVRWRENTAVVSAAGDIDMTSSVPFQQEVLKILDNRPKRIVISLGDVDYMDSSGLASLVKLLSRSRKTGAAIVLAGLKPRVKSLFEITRLNSIFRICDTVEEAMTA